MSTSPTVTNESLRFVIKFSLLGGALLILFGFGQFFISMGLDKLGVIEVGNGLGLGLLLYLTVPIGALLLIFGAVVALVRFLSRPKESEAQADDH